MIDPHGGERIFTRVSSAEAAQDAISRAEAAQINRDRLQSALPKLREKLSAALAEEAKWFADYRRVRQKLDEAATLFKQYPEHAQAIADLFELAEAVDREVSRINGSAPEGVGHRLKTGRTGSPRSGTLHTRQSRAGRQRRTERLGQ